MSPVQTATREQNGKRNRRLPDYSPVEVLFATDAAAGSEIVVDWQLPSDMEHDRR